MKLPGPLTPDQEAQLNTVAGRARYLLALVTDLLDLSQIESGQIVATLADVSCREVVDEVSAQVRPEAERKGLSFQLVRPVADASVRADRRIFTRILLTLTADAVKFTENGHVRLSVALAHDGVGITVADTSLITPPGDQALSFGFEAANANAPSPYDARRLGLYSSGKLAALIGGRIDFAGGRGRGCAFTLTLQSAISPDNGTGSNPD